MNNLTDIRITNEVASRIIFRTQLDGAIEASRYSNTASFRFLQDIAARLAEDLPEGCEDAANLLIAFAMLARVSDSRTILETFADLVDGIPPYGVDEGDRV